MISSVGELHSGAAPWADLVPGPWPESRGQSWRGIGPGRVLTGKTQATGGQSSREGARGAVPHARRRSS